MVWKPSRILVVKMHSRMSGGGWEALPDVREWSGAPTGFLDVIKMHSQMSGSGRKTPRMYGSGLEALLDVREWLRCPPGCPGVVGRPSQMFGSGREILPDVPEL